MREAIKIESQGKKGEVSRKKKLLVSVYRCLTGCECKSSRWLARSLNNFIVWMEITAVMIESCLFLA